MLANLRDVFVVAPASSFHHHHHHDAAAVLSASEFHHSLAATTNQNTAATALGVGVIPLLTATPVLENDNIIRNRGIQFWQDQHQHHHQQQQHRDSLVQGIGGVMSGGSGGSSGTATCQDCGNQAKKDCTHRRCRTCCKSRGFDCATHVKSTWVPAARRRERQLMSGGTGTVAVAGSSGSTSGTKKPRLIASQTTTNSHTSTSNTTPPRSFETTSSHQDVSLKEKLPSHVRAPAVFKCVRVTSVDDGEDEFAYQAVVKIGGRVFKGFLYDQGVNENRDNSNVYPNLSELHLGGGGGSGGGGGGAGAGAGLDPSDVYGAPGGG